METKPPGTKKTPRQADNDGGRWALGECALRSRAGFLCVTLKAAQAKVTSESVVRCAPNVFRSRGAKRGLLKQNLVGWALQPPLRATAPARKRTETSQHRVSCSMVDNMDVHDSAQRLTSPRSQRSRPAEKTIPSSSASEIGRVLCVHVRRPLARVSPRVRAAVFAFSCAHEMVRTIFLDNVRLFRCEARASRFPEVVPDDAHTRTAIAAIAAASLKDAKAPHGNRPPDPQCCQLTRSRAARQGRLRCTVPSRSPATCGASR
jgi:hypothetical protein